MFLSSYSQQTNFQPMPTDYSLSRQKRIVRGENAEISEFPYLVQIVERKAEIYEFVCGGTIIHERIILTAVHCFINFYHKYLREENLLTIVAGTKFKDGRDGDRYNVEEYYASPGFNFLTGASDIGLIKVLNNDK